MQWREAFHKVGNKIGSRRPSPIAAGQIPNRNFIDLKIADRFYLNAINSSIFSIKSSVATAFASPLQPSTKEAYPDAFDFSSFRTPWASASYRIIMLSALPLASLRMRSASASAVIYFLLVDFLSDDFFRISLSTSAAY